MKLASLFAAAALAAATAVAAQTAPPDAPMTERTDRIGLEGRRGPGLFRPGFAIGEYTGSATSRGSSTRLPWQSRDMARAEFDLALPGGTVQGDCGGGQSHSRILWITFGRGAAAGSWAMSSAATASRSAAST